MDEEFVFKKEQTREEVMRCLDEMGIPMKKGEKKPAHGIYSGIIDIRDEKLIVQIPPQK